MRNTIRTILKMKGKKPIVMLSLYEHYLARLCDAADIDIVLVGDTMGSVLYGYETTLPVTLDMVIRHGETVVRATEKALVVVDLPFLTYQVSIEEAMLSAGKVLQKTGAQAIKIEGCSDYLIEVIQRMSESGIPVMGHLGLTPQSIHSFGGFLLQGKNEDSAQKLFLAAKRLEEAGCFSVVLENIPNALSARITGNIGIPTIGISAGPDNDGQVLVAHDVLGVNHEFNPKFVKRYANLEEIILKAMKEYRKDVEEKKYPSEEHYK